MHSYYTDYKGSHPEEVPAYEERFCVCLQLCVQLHVPASSNQSAIIKENSSLKGNNQTMQLCYVSIVTSDCALVIM